MPSPAFHSFRTSPALYLAFCFALGIAAADYARSIPFLAWAVAAPVVMLAAALAGRRMKRRLVSLYPLILAAAIGLGAFSAGAAAHSSALLLPPTHVINQLDGPRAFNLARLKGRVIGEPVSYSSGWRFDLAVQVVRHGEIWKRASGRVRVLLRNAESSGMVPAIEAGREIQITGLLRRAEPRRNPADFDYRAYLERRGIYHTLSVESASLITVLPSRPGVLGLLVSGTRRYIEDRLRQHVSSPEAQALARALLLGDRHAVDETTLLDFRRTGLAHLLAVSGLHVMLVGLVVYHLLIPLLTRLRLPWSMVQRARAVITLLILLAYMALTGSSPSTVRAVVMAAVFIGADVLQRSSNVTNGLGVAALVLLIARPAALFDAGFQLSFAAVAAIGLLYPVLRSQVPDAWLEIPGGRYVTSSLFVSLAAGIGTAPFLFYHFGQVSLAPPLLNLIAIPLTTLLLAASLAVVLFHPVSIMVADLYGSAADGLAHALLSTAGLGHRWMDWAVMEGAPNVWVLLIGTAGTGLLLVSRHPRVRGALMALALLCANGFVWQITPDRNELEVIFFDVGHGDAALITTPGRQHILIDAGGRNAWNDEAVHTILPHLRRYGVRALDAVVITHPHSDHLGGLPSLLRALPIHMVMHNGDMFSSALFEETRHVMDSLAIPARTLRAGDAVEIDPAIHIGVLFPTASALDSEDPNHASIVLRVAYGQNSFLLMGDADAQAEREILTRYADLLPGAVVKVGHHGSITSSSLPFVRRIASGSTPLQLAVVSADPNSVYGLPDPEIVERWQEHGASVLTTGAEGAVWLRSDGKRVQRVEWR